MSPNKLRRLEAAKQQLAKQRQDNRQYRHEMELAGRPKTSAGLMLATALIIAANWRGR
jgi:hypothetical protein